MFALNLLSMAFTNLMTIVVKDSDIRTSTIGVKTMNTKGANSAINSFKATST